MCPAGCYCHPMASACHPVTSHCHLAVADCHPLTPVCHPITSGCHLMLADCHLVAPGCHPLRCCCHLVVTQQQLSPTAVCLSPSAVCLSPADSHPTPRPPAHLTHPFAWGWGLFFPSAAIAFGMGGAPMSPPHTHSTGAAPHPPHHSVPLHRGWICTFLGGGGRVWVLIAAALGWGGGNKSDLWYEMWPCDAGGEGGRLVTPLCPRGGRQGGARVDCIA